MCLLVDSTQVRKASDLDDISIETTKTERQRELKKKKNIRFSKSVSTSKGVTYV